MATPLSAAKNEAVEMALAGQADSALAVKTKRCGEATGI